MKKSDNNSFIFSYTAGETMPAHMFDKEGNFIGKQENTGDGIIRLQYQKNSRGGKTVTVIFGFDTSTNLNILCSELKKKTGTGGTVKNGKIEIQGDKREIIETYLAEKGFKTKRAGG